jgi:hypothetical protein
MTASAMSCVLPPAVVVTSHHTRYWPAVSTSSAAQSYRTVPAAADTTVAAAFTFSVDEPSARILNFTVWPVRSCAVPLSFRIVSVIDGLTVADPEEKVLAHTTVTITQSSVTVSALNWRPSDSHIRITISAFVA